ncbi:MAG: hypothetical protein NVS1B7_1770 [Candidatus Saccharimonadales bacterium]
MTQYIDRISYFAQIIKNCSQGELDPACQTTLPQIAANDANLKLILQLVFGIISTVTIIFIMIASFKFVIANGDPQTIAKARQSILYAVIGLVIALSAEIIVTFVLGNV